MKCIDKDSRSDAEQGEEKWKGHPRSAHALMIIQEHGTKGTPPENAVAYIL